MRRIAGIALLLFTVATVAPAAPRIRLGGVVVGGSYSNGWYGPGWWGPGYARPWGFYDPFWYGGGPWIHPGFYGGWMQGPGMGEVKVSNVPRDAVVLIDGAYAGEARKLKSMWLEPGVYNLEVRLGDSSFQKKVYVLSGKTLELRADLRPAVTK
jgi:hypothetical protein